MTLKIAMICLNIEGRGTYQRAYNLAKSLSTFGHHLTLLASDLSGKQIQERNVDNISLVTFPSLVHGSLQSGWDVYETIKRIQWLRNKEFDIVHAFESRPNVIYPALYAKKRGAALFTDWADWFGKGGSVEERPNPIRRTLLRPVETFFEENYRNRALGTTVICSTLYERATQLGIDEESILLLNNGLNNSTLQPLDKTAARTRVNLSQDNYIIGYVGASFPRDVKLMRQSFEHVKAKIPEAMLLHIGRSNYSVESDVSVIQTGNVDDEKLNDYLNACDLFWLPLGDSNANRGRFPIKLSDYLSVGRPIVTTSVGDIKGFIEENNVGLIAKDNPQNIAEKVINLYENRALAKIFSQNALNLANSYEHSWQKCARDLESFYLSKMI